MILVHKITAAACGLSLLACPAAREAENQPTTTGKSAAAGKDEHAMTSYDTETIATSYMSARRGPTGARAVVVPIRSAADWTALAEAMQADLRIDIGPPPVFDEGREAILFVEFPNHAGTEMKAVVDGFERADSVGRVIGRFVANPEGEMLDVQIRSYVVVKLARAALEGDPTLSLELGVEQP